MELPYFEANFLNLLWAFLALFYRDAFSSPHPQYYCLGDYLTLKVNTLSSDWSALPLQHYSLPFCPPLGGVENTPLNIGQLIMGDRVQSSPYEFKINTNQSSVLLCRTSPLSPLKAVLFRQLIRDYYHVNFLLDHLPAHVVSPVKRTGVPIGVNSMNKYYVYSHLKFRILTKKKGGCFAVVGLEVDAGTLKSEIKERMQIEFTYEVTFEESNVEWDTYLTKRTPKGLWLSVFTPSVVGVFLLFWTVIHRRRSSAEDDGDTLIKMESCCTSYQSPPCPLVLCVAFGTGAQLVSTACLTALLWLSGLLSESPRGTLITMIVYCYTFSSFVGGYAAVCLRKTVGHPGWESVTWRVALFFPAIAISIFTVTSFTYGHHSSTAILFSILCLLWASVCVPLTFIGGYFSSRSRHVAHSFSYTRTPVEASSQELLQACLGVLLLGCLPYKAIEYDLFYTVNSFWKGRYFMEFDTHVMIMGALVLACAEASIICNLERLHNDRLWWWKAFFGSGSCGMYVFCYLIEYPGFRSQYLTSSSVIVIGHSILIGLATMLATGAVGMLFTFLFLNFAVRTSN